MPLFEHLSDRLRASGLDTDIYPFSDTSTVIDNYPISTPRDVLEDELATKSPAELVAELYFADSKKLRKRNVAILTKSRKIGTRYDGVIVHTAIFGDGARGRDAVLRTIEPELVAQILRDIVRVNVELVEEDKEPKGEGFMVTPQYLFTKAYPDKAYVTATPSLQEKLSHSSYDKKWKELIRGNHALGFADWDALGSFDCLGFSSCFSSSGYAGEEFKRESRFNVVVDGTTHVFGVNDIGIFYRGSLLPDGSLNLRSAMFSFDNSLTPFTSERDCFPVRSNERVPVKMACYLDERYFKQQPTS